MDDAGASKFSALVRESSDVLDLLVAGEVAHLFAPSDSNASHELKARHGILVHRGTNSTTERASLQAISFNQKLEQMQTTTSGLSVVKRGATHPETSSPDYGFVVETVHDANLNHNSDQNLVVQPVEDSSPKQRIISPTGEEDDFDVIAQVYSGLGNVVDILKGTFKFARCANGTGSIFVAKNYFTIPERLCSTAKKLNLTTFISLVKCSGLGEFLDIKPSITVFIPSNEAYEDAGTPDPDHKYSMDTTGKLKALVVPNFLGYTPNLEDGQTLTSMNGTKIEIAINGDGIFVNGGKIIKRDIILENGVAHVIDRVCRVPISRSVIGES